MSTYTVGFLTPATGTDVLIQTTTVTRDYTISPSITDDGLIGGQAFLTRDYTISETITGDGLIQLASLAPTIIREYFVLTGLTQDSGSAVGLITTGQLWPLM